MTRATHAIPAAIMALAERILAPDGGATGAMLGISLAAAMGAMLGADEGMALAPQTSV